MIKLLIRLKNIPDSISHQTYFLRTSFYQAPSLKLMETAITGVYGQLELYQIRLQSNPLFEPICSGEKIGGRNYIDLMKKIKGSMLD